MEFQGIRLIDVKFLGLSQIYLNEAKIKAVEKWFDPDKMDKFNPLAIHSFDNKIYTLTDGHTRAYVAYKNGISVLPAVYDNDEIVAGAIGTALYKADIEWCGRYGLRHICDLKNRIVSDENYAILWMNRCDRSYDLLTQTSEAERIQLQSIFPDLYLYGASEDKSELYYEDRKGQLYVYRKNQIKKEAIFE